MNNENQNQEWAQPEVSTDVLDDLEDRGLIVPEKSTHRGFRRHCLVRNVNAGDVVGYSTLVGKLKAGEISREDARILLAIESTRAKGARKTHIDRLTAKAAVDNTKEIKGCNVNEEEHYL